MHDHTPSPNWFTAAEIASVVRNCSLSVFPSSEQGVKRWIEREASAFPDSFGQARDRLSRKRPGKGGPTEFHVTLFDLHGLRQLLFALEMAAQQRQQGMSVRQAPSDDLLTLNDEDEAIMRSMLPAEARHRNGNFEPLRARSVKRRTIELRTERYCSFDLRPFEGRKVMVTYLPGYPPIIFAWRCDGSGKRLLCHGPKGLICMIDEPIAKTGIYIAL